MTADHLRLTDAALAALGLTTREIVGAIERAVRDEAGGRLATAPKTGVLPGDGRYAMATLAVGGAPPLVVVKSVLVSPRNPGRGLPAIGGAILVLDGETGALRAVMDAGWITEVRTAGLSAVAALRLADPAARRIAFIGCGAQARSHLAAFADLFPLAELRAFGRGRANVGRLIALGQARGIAGRAAADPGEAIDGAEIVVSSVPAQGTAPFLDARRLAPGTFLASPDMAAPWLPDSLGALGTVIIDDLAQDRALGEPMVDPALVRGDLRGLVAADTPARDPARPAAFFFRGMAVGDFAVAALALARAHGQHALEP